MKKGIETSTAVMWIIISLFIFILLIIIPRILKSLIIK
jgi:hypothetical protein